jgi:hypothetical protein
MTHIDMILESSLCFELAIRATTVLSKGEIVMSY